MRHFFRQKTLYAKLDDSYCEWVQMNETIKIVSYVKAQNKYDMSGSLLCVL